MTKREQIRFVREMCNGIRKAVIENIEASRLPFTWDDHELREYVYQRASRYRSSYLTGKRLREYKNTVLVNNL